MLGVHQGGENLHPEFRPDVGFSDFWDGGDVDIETGSYYSNFYWSGVNLLRVSYVWVGVLIVAGATAARKAVVDPAIVLVVMMFQVLWSCAG